MYELPGQRVTDAGTTPRQFLMTTHDVVELPGPIVLDHTNSYDGANTGRTDELRAGQVMAQITASKKWVPVMRTVVVGSGTLTALVVRNAAAFQVGQHIDVGADTDIAVTAIDYTTNTLTIASTTVVDGEAVIARTLKDGTTSAAGSEIARGILSQSVRLLTGIPYETSKAAKSGVIVCKAFVNTSMILGDYAACLASGVTNYLSGILWSDRQGV